MPLGPQPVPGPNIPPSFQIAATATTDLFNGIATATQMLGTFGRLDLAKKQLNLSERQFEHAQERFGKEFDLEERQFGEGIRQADRDFDERVRQFDGRQELAADIFGLSKEKFNHDKQVSRENIELERVGLRISAENAATNRATTQRLLENDSFEAEVTDYLMGGPPPASRRKRAEIDSVDVDAILNRSTAQPGPGEAPETEGFDPDLITSDPSVPPTGPGLNGGNEQFKEDPTPVERYRRIKNFLPSLQGSRSAKSIARAQALELEMKRLLADPEVQAAETKDQADAQSILLEQALSILPASDERIARAEYGRSIARLEKGIPLHADVFENLIKKVDKAGAPEPTAASVDKKIAQLANFQTQANTAPPNIQDFFDSENIPLDMDSVASWSVSSRLEPALDEDGDPVLDIKTGKDAMQEVFFLTYLDKNRKKKTIRTPEEGVSHIDPERNAEYYKALINAARLAQLARPGASLQVPEQPSSSGPEPIISEPADDYIKRQLQSLGGQ